MVYQYVTMSLYSYCIFMDVFFHPQKCWLWSVKVEIVLGMVNYQDVSDPTIELQFISDLTQRILVLPEPNTLNFISWSYVKKTIHKWTLTNMQ